MDTRTTRMGSLYDNYKRPAETLQDSLQNDISVKEKLEGYQRIEIEDLNYIPQNTPIRYLTKKDGKVLFRLGGNFVLNKPEYIVLKSINNVTWCVQKNNTIFYRALSKEERDNTIIEEQDKIIEDQQDEIEYLKKLLEAKK